MSGRTLILGGGFGGIAAAVELRSLLGDEHEVVLVDRNPDFTMGLRKLWELVGIASVAEGSRARSLLSRHGITFIEADVTAIDPAARAADTSAGRLDGDRLVVALGAIGRPDLVPGLTSSPVSPSTGTTSGRSPASRRRPTRSGTSTAAASWC
jgi:sulfide:quinone oxidoreductase